MRSPGTLILWPFLVFFSFGEELAYLLKMACIPTPLPRRGHAEAVDPIGVIEDDQLIPVPWMHQLQLQGGGEGGPDRRRQSPPEGPVAPPQK